MSTRPAAHTDRLRAFGVGALGIILAAVPLALWVAWTPGMFLVVLGMGWAASVLIIALVDWQRFAGDDGHALRGGDSAAAVSDEFVAEIQRISPLTYHHAWIEKARFRTAMEKLRQLLR
jgi:hypothetical protein